MRWPLALRDWATCAVRILGRQRSRRAIPVILQTTATDCGAACLAMILGYWGRSTPASECRELLGIGRDGSTARALVRVARSLGLRAVAYSMEPADLARLERPAIL